MYKFPIDCRLSDEHVLCDVVTMSIGSCAYDCVYVRARACLCVCVCWCVHARGRLLIATNRQNEHVALFNQVHSTNQYIEIIDADRVSH